MQAVSDTYRAIFNSEHRKETKLLIAGVEHGQGRIVSLRTYGSLFEKPTVGACVSRQIDLSFYPLETPPRQAKIEVKLRLVGDTQASEWIPKGEFFFSTRNVDKLTGIMTVHGYDAMRKADAVWLTSDYDEENWPRTPEQVAQDIAARMGVELDERCVFDNSFLVPYPVGENGDLTMREVLSGIAVSCAGNWTITDTGKLRLIRYDDVPDPTNYLVTESGSAITFGGVRILVG